MKVLILAIFALMSLAALSAANKQDNKNIYSRSQELQSPFDVISLNSPVIDSDAKFLLKVPNGFDIEEVRYKIRNSSRLFDKDQPLQKINLIDGANGKELHVSVSKLPPGFYQLYVKVKDKKNKEHDYKNKYKDHAVFVIEKPKQVPWPDPKINDKTIAGVDSDNDGIRDDIQIWIDKEFLNQPQVKMAMKQLAMAEQLELLSVSNRDQSIKASNQVLDSSQCLRALIGTDDMAKNQRELDLKLLNTKDRLYVNIKSNSNFSGQSYTLPNSKEEGLALCNFSTKD